MTKGCLRVNLWYNSYKEVIGVRRIIEVIAALSYRYAKLGAGSASYHGSYEASVPQKLQATK